jgi:NAD+ kinase
VLTLGGDGTFLYACSLFQGQIPPVMPFHLGSLGFCTRFAIDSFQHSLTRVFNGKQTKRWALYELGANRNEPSASSTGDARITYRTRLMCRVVKRDPINQQAHHQQFVVLNDVVLDRGAHPFLSNVELCINDRYVTTLQGDGLIVATPTGSTAYSAATGASMLHPAVSGMVISPICPHSLSFRPIVVPNHVEIKVSAWLHVCRPKCFKGNAICCWSTLVLD